MTDDVIKTISEILGDAYVVERMLAGGMSRVAVAREVALGRRVVVKMLPADWAAGLNVDRFRREVVLAAGLQHPLIVPLLMASAAADGTLFYTMPFVDGPSLRSRLELGVPSLNDSVRWLRDIASALAYAHQRGVVHRDMKPDNVLLSGGYAVVADFGIAKALTNASTTMTQLRVAVDPITTMGISLGTPAYMAPEQVAGDAMVDHRTDIYALGIIAYELLTGEAPFKGSTQAILVAQLTAEPEPLLSRRADVPDALRDLVMRCLAKDPADRPDTADEIVAALESVLRSMSGTTEATRVRARASPQTGRETARPRSVVTWKSLRISTAIAGVALVTAGVWASMGNRSAAASPNRVAVATLRVSSNDTVLREIARGVAADIAGELSAVDGSDVVGRERVERAESALSVEDAAPQALARSLSAAFIVTGQISPAGGDSVRLRLALVSGVDGAIIHTLNDVHVARANVHFATASLRQRLAGALAAVSSPDFGRGMLPKGDPPTVSALAAVREGLYLEAGLRTTDPGEDESSAELARFDRAVAADPEFTQARLWFASAALRRPGGEVLADSALTLAQARGEDLSEYEHALLDALRADVRGNSELSVRRWRDARKLAPSWPNRWWLAIKLRDVNRPKESLALFDTLGRENALFRRTIPALHHYLSEFSDEYRALQEERARAPSTAQSLGFQQALLQSLSAMKDSTPVVRKLLEGASQLPAEPGSSLAYLLTRTSWELGAHGHKVDSESTLQRAVTWCRARTAADLSNGAVAFDCMEAYGYAGIIAPMTELAERTFQARPKDVDLAVLGVLGLAAALRGERAVAEQFATRVEQNTRADGSHGLASWLRARIAAALGDRDRAVQLLEDAFARGAGWSQRLDLHRDPAFASMRGVAAFERLRQPQG